MKSRQEAKRIFLAEQIYQDLKSDILSGKYQYEETIPVEIELEKMYGVSRITARAAMQKLLEDGLVARKRGKGTISIWKPDNKIVISLHPDWSLEKEMADRDNSMELYPVKGGFTKVFGQNDFEPFKEELNEKDICYEKKIIRINRVRMAELIRCAPVSCAEPIMNNESLMPEGYKRKTLAIETKISKDISKDLQLSNDCPVMIVTSVLYLSNDVNEKPVIFETWFYRGDYCTLSV